MAEVIIVWMSFPRAAEELEETIGVVAQTAEAADDFRLAGGENSFKLSGVVHAKFVSTAC